MRLAIASFAVAAVVASLSAFTAQDGSHAALKIVVLEGEDAVNIIRKKTAVAPIVEVRDRNDLPVAGVVVAFSIGGSGGATFAGGARTLTVVTNSLGRATAAGLTPTTNGALQISASATFQGQTAVATIAQTNVLTAAQAASMSGATAGSGGGLSHGALAAIGGGAAAGGIATAVLTRSGSTPPPRITVTPTGAGIQNVTAFSFAAAGGAASTAYRWDFGDGATAQGPTATHVYSSAAQFQVTLRSGESANAQDAATTVLVGSLTGNWYRAPVQGVVARLVAVQEGTSLTGAWITEFESGSPFGSPQNNNSVPLRGTITSPRGVTFEQVGECRRTVTAGSVSADLNTMGGPGYFGNPACGDGTGALTAGWTFVRQ